jgi:hypothetical protein
MKDLMDKAYGSIFPASGDSAASTAMSGFGTMAGIENSKKALAAQQQADQSGGMGDLIGLVLSLL